MVVSKIALIFPVCEEALIMSVPKRSGGSDCSGFYFENKSRSSVLSCLVLSMVNSISLFVEKEI